MNDLLELIIFVLFILGGSCSVAGAWCCRNKKKQNVNEHQGSK